MNARMNLLSEIARTVDLGAGAERGVVLQHLIAHFERVAETLDDPALDMFDAVFMAVTGDGDEAGRCALSSALASNPRAPAKTIRSLASDDSIAVAGRVLRCSPCLDDETLVAIAQAQGQDHLLAMAGRASLAPPVTDVITSRGDAPVLHVLIANAGARFSEEGAIRLRRRAEDDPVLMAHMRRREDMRAALAQALRRPAVAGTIVPQGMAFAAGAAVEAALERGALDQALKNLAQGARVPARVVERCFATDPLETFVVLARAADITVPSLRAMLTQRMGIAASENVLNTAEKLFCDITRQHALRTARIFVLRDRELYN